MRRFVCLVILVVFAGGGPFGCKGGSDAKVQTSTQKQAIPKEGPRKGGEAAQ